MARKPHILIAGAGVGGLTAALALLKRGFDVDVYEQALEIMEVGAGFQISANGTRVLYELGLGAEIKAICWEPEGKEIRIWNTGETKKLFDLGAESVERYGYPYLTFHRADLQQVLADAVRQEKPDAIHVDSRCAGFNQDGDRVALRLDNGVTVEGDALIGADGVHSAIRQCLFGDDRPEFTGCMAWRGVIPAERLPPDLIRPVATNWVGPGHHVIHYFLRRGELLNFVGIVERDDWQIESWSAEGTHAECAADFEGWDETVHAMIRNITTPFKWALMGRDPLKFWSVGRVSLLGDACHPTLPFLAQGAVMAIEDGMVLARCLESHDDVETALARYQDVRVERTAKVVHDSAENTARFHNKSLADPAKAGQYVEEQWLPERVRERYDWLFVYDATSVAV
jgi:salicylate hydroxylase